MFRKALVSLVVTATLGVGTFAMTSAAEAHRRHHHGNFTIGLGFSPFLGSGYPAYGYGYRNYGYRNYGYRYPVYYDDYYGYEDCGYRRVLVKKWNKAHTKRIKVYKKRWVCY
jgi:hypothetical protein